MCSNFIIYINYLHKIVWYIFGSLCGDFIFFKRLIYFLKKSAWISVIFSIKYLLMFGSIKYPFYTKERIKNVSELEAGSSTGVGRGGQGEHKVAVVTVLCWNICTQLLYQLLQNFNLKLVSFFHRIAKNRNTTAFLYGQRWNSKSSLWWERDIFWNQVIIIFACISCISTMQV